MSVRRRAELPAASFGPALILSAVLALAAFLIVMALLLLVAHPQNAGLGAAAGVANQQNQNAKTSLYVVAFLVLVPGAVIAGPRIADRIASGANRTALQPLSHLLAAGLCLLLVAARLSGHLPWGDGIGVVLILFAPALLLVALVLRRAAANRPWPLLARLAGRGRASAVIAALSVLAAVLSVTHVQALSLVPLVVGLLLVTGALVLHRGLGALRVGGRIAALVDGAAVLVLLLAVTNVVVYHSALGVPNAFFPPGVFQFQQDWIIGPANQLLGGGAVMVNDPVSQYGVGMLYFLAGWFHLAPIGYGTFALLDGLLTALLYAAGYCILRLAGARPWLAISALAVAVLALVYNLYYPVGALPEQGPLRFGIPMGLILARVAAARRPRATWGPRVVALLVLGVASVWALEAFAYTTVTYVAMVAAEASLQAAGNRRRHVVRELALGLGVVLSAHALFALATFLGSGQFPAWGEYLAYIHSLLFGGKEGSITYGFERWSPGLAMGAAAAGSAAAVVLLVRRSRELAREHQVTVVALAGMTVYEIAIFSYTDSRASTYLLPYVALPLLLTGALWLTLLGRSAAASAVALTRGAFALGGALAVILIATAWPAIGAHFTDSALAHAYPGGGLRRSLTRLWHSPAIDPRAPDGQGILTRYFPGRRAIVLLPTAQDLGIEILMRSGKANQLFIGDPIMDDFIPQVWVPKIARQIGALRPGDRILSQDSALALLARLRRLPPFDPLQHQTGSAIPTAVYNAPELVWTLQQIDRRFVSRTIYHDANGYRVLGIVARR